MSRIKREISAEMAQQIIYEVEINSQLLSDVAKQFGVSNRAIYKIVKNIKR